MLSSTRLAFVVSISTILSVAFQSPACFAQTVSAPDSQSATSSSTSSQSTVSQSATEPKTASELLQTRLSLGDGRDTWHPTIAQLGFSLPSGTDPSTPASQVRLIPNRSKAIAYFTGIAPYVRRAPVNARPVVLAAYSHESLNETSSSKPVPAKILPSREGAALLIDQSADAVIGALTENPLTVHIVLPIRKDPPKVTGESLAGIDARIARFVTHFNPGEVGRTKTVRKAINLINNSIVPPGQIFSVNQTVGERTAARGFGVGKVFKDGRMQTDVGGGMCQVASTLFNAALLANLEIVERHQHVRTVPYVKAGSDATIWWGKKDFKFENDSSAPVFISYRTTATHAICEIFGKAEAGTKVSVVAVQRRLGERDYAGSITRYTVVDGKAQKTYQAFSHYKWTPALDYSR